MDIDVSTAKATYNRDRLNVKHSSIKMVLLSWKKLSLVFVMLVEIGITVLIYCTRFMRLPRAKRELNELSRFLLVI